MAKITSLIVIFIIIGGIMVVQGKTICILPKDPGPCLAIIPRYYFDKDAGECEKFIYRGCEGNANRFETLAACEKTCNTCLLPKDPGQCYGRFPRYYFNKRAGKCIKFIYGGCCGNANNFATKRACKKKCGNKKKSI